MNDETVHTRLRRNGLNLLRRNQAATNRTATKCGNAKQVKAYYNFANTLTCAATLRASGDRQ